MITGRVAKLFWSHGFVIQDGTADEFFFHLNQCTGTHFDDLNVGDRVEFEVGADGSGRLRCYNLRRLDAVAERDR